MGSAAASPQPSGNLTQDELKRVAAHRAVEFVESGMTLGLGTGMYNSYRASRMNQAVSSTSTRGRGKSERVWTYFEDEALLKALFELSLDPKWKSEGSFKNGYLSVLKATLAEKIPGCGLTAVPHIESRVRHFRTKYGAIEVMLANSGFSWDENRKMVQCEKQQYEDHCKRHPDAKGLYGISFPHLDTLAAIYGKDIATGKGAEGLGDAISNLEKEITLEESHDREVEEDSMSRETPRWASDRNLLDSTSSTSKRRKRDKGNEVRKSSDPFLDMLGEFRDDLKNASNHFGKMTEIMEREAKLQEEAAHKDPMQVLQQKSITELTRLGFTSTELVKAASVFVNVPNQMTMLFALPETLRRGFILNMLANVSMVQFSHIRLQHFQIAS
ncbi:putative ribose-5-phosphate isomerase 2, partial [Zea mays]